MDAQSVEKRMGMTQEGGDNVDLNRKLIRYRVCVHATM